MRKIIVILSVFLISFCQLSVRAANFSFTPTDDIFANYRGSYNINPYTHNLYFSSKQHKAFLKFDISSIPLTEKIITASLSVHGQNSFGNNPVNLINFGIGLYKTDLYIYDVLSGTNISWSEENKFRWHQYEPPGIPNLATPNNFLANAQKLDNDSIFWNLEDNLDYLNSNDYLSLMVQLGQTQYDSNGEFASKDFWEDSNQWPNLKIVTAPVPEPSSIALGLISLAGLAFRKRNKNV